MNRPTKRYNYNRAGVAMLTLKTRPGTRLCCITQETFALTETGRVVQQAVIGVVATYALMTGLCPPSSILSAFIFIQQSALDYISAL
jgi:hypothetical protein